MQRAETGSQAGKRIRVRPRFFVIVTLFLLVTYAVYGYVSGFLRMRALTAEIEEVRRQIAELQTLNAQLEAQLLEYDNDEVIERIAREQLRLVTPGERPVIVIEAPAEDNADR
ncbi:MAG: septum formation initiator family protein [Limnochordales bacterium]|nr:MAG: hypothetical protein DIU83_01395 [Bacillota bacterium]